MKKIIQSIGILLGAPALLVALVWGYNLYFKLGSWFGIEETGNLSIFSILGILFSIGSVIWVLALWSDTISGTYCDRCGKKVELDSDSRHIIKAGSEKSWDFCENCKDKIEVK